MDLELKGKIALITGASRGIGKAAALAFAKEGATLVICARGREELLRSAEEFRSYGVEVAPYTADVSNIADIKSLFEQVKSRFGKLDILINNAGEGHRSAEIIPSDEVWQQHFDQYFLSVVRMIREAVPLMIDNGGRVVNISSGNWLSPGDGSPTRSTMKAAVTTLTKSLANYYGKKGIIFNVVSPGLIATERLYAPGGVGGAIAKRLGLPLEEGLKKHAQDTQGLGRFATPEEVANVIVFLCSNRASGVLGSDFFVDAGGH